jgi:uncharacterized Fe-S cluster-containing radical SAM superfamily protein
MKQEMQRNKKFDDPLVTAEGEKRAWVGLTSLKTLWFNTGTLCNLACANCYMESTPTNDRLSYLTLAEAVTYFDEIEAEGYPTEKIGITGGEPFMNPDIIPIMEESLCRGYHLLILTNAMRPMMRHESNLIRLNDTYGAQMTVRVSVDHFKREFHDEERGPQSWAHMMKGLTWLSENNFKINVAGRTRWGEAEGVLREGFAAFFNKHKIRVDAYDEKQLVLFPEMDSDAPVAEITTDCWKKLGVDPNDMMCATSRMVIKHKRQDKPSVVVCTLLPYDQRFNMGQTLKGAARFIQLNHPHCAKFCVLGGGACSR